MSDFKQFPIDTESSKDKANLFSDKHFHFFLPPRPGEKAEIRVYAIGEKIKIHTKKSKTKKGTQKFTPIRCTLQEDPEGRCVGCSYHESDPTISYAQTNRIVSVIDFRKIHLVNSPTGKYKETKFCSAPNCVYCDQEVPAEYSGTRHWLMGPKYYGFLQHQHMKLGDKCVKCRTGVLSPLGVVCEKCGERLLSKDAYGSMNPIDQKKLLFTTIKCNECSHEGFPEEKLHCSNDCEEPKRSTVFDTNLEIEKIQTGETTNLIITPTMQFEDLPERFVGAEPYKAEDIAPLFSLDIQSKLYGVKNPWGASSDYATKSNSEEDFFKQES